MDLAPQQNIGDMMRMLLAGETIRLVAGLSTAIMMGTKRWEHRLPEEPVSEPVVRDERLRVQAVRLGKRTGTTAVGSMM